MRASICFCCCASFNSKCSLLFNSAVLFQKLVEQHRVHCFVAHRVNFAILVANYQIRVHFFYFLSYQAELRDAIWIKLFLVAEGTGLSARIASLALSIGLIASLKRAEDDACPVDPCCLRRTAAPCNRFPSDASDKGGGLCSLRADANGVASPATPSIADIDVVIASSEIETG